MIVNYIKGFLQLSPKEIHIGSIQIRFKSSINKKLNKILIEMPRSNKHIAEAQIQRLKIKEKACRFQPGVVSLQILGNGAPGAPASVYLFTDQSRYLFNCGEGTQRLAHEHKTKLARLENIFLTRTCWDRVGGLPGLSLTVQDSGVPNLTLYGPPGLDEIFGGMRRFVVLKHLKVRAVNCENGAIYDDQVMEVHCVPIKKKAETLPFTSSESVVIDTTDYFAYEADTEGKQTPVQLTEAPRMADLTKREEHAVIAYICKLKPKSGALNLEKCVEKGVTPGPLLGKLKAGFDVELPNGTTVKAADVRAPTDPGPVFIFLDIPDESYLYGLNSTQKFESYQNKNYEQEDIPLVIIHFSPQYIVESFRYKQFIEKFPTSTRHLILNSTNSFSGYTAAHRLQWQLNQLNDNIFPILKENCEVGNQTEIIHKRFKMSEEFNNASVITKKSNIPILEKLDFIADGTNSLTTYHLRPRKGLDRTHEPFVNPLEYLTETHAVDGFTAALERLKLRYEKINCDTKDEYPKLVFLGTGSCIPNKTRNVSSVLIHTTDSACIILDCGEGTWGQLVRFYGEVGAMNVLKKLKAIFISHLHADHHIGLIGILKARQQLFSQEPIVLLAPVQIQAWLHFYDQRIEGIRKQYYLIQNASLCVKPLSDDTTEEMGVESISTCYVHHCPHSFAIAIVLKEKCDEINKVKITYSGDTMPCDSLVELGANSTILIHEATMEDELAAEAKFKMHSTISQAIEQGTKMSAENIILTHFSQRYAKLPRLERKLKAENVAIAFDNMQVTLHDLKYFHLMYICLNLMFSDHCMELEQKAMKRALKQERKRSLSPPTKIIDLNSIK